MTTSNEDGKSRFLRDSFLFFDYVSAVESLLQIANKREDRDISDSIYPIAYLFRHSLELGVKNIINLHGEEYPHGHSLDTLKEQFEKLVGANGDDDISWTFTESQQTIVDSKFEEIKKMVKGLSEERLSFLRDYNLSPFLKLLEKYNVFDSTSTRFRYSDNPLSYEQKKDMFTSVTEDVEIVRSFGAFLGLFISVGIETATRAQDTIKPKSENN